MTTATATSLNLNDDDAFLRGIEYADQASIEHLIHAIRALRTPSTYSYQDVDCRMDLRAEIINLRKIGNTPIARR
jgi:hypothetical protein